MKFMVENKIAEKQKSSLGDNGKEINFQLETLLINDLFKFQECKEE